MLKVGGRDCHAARATPPRRQHPPQAQERQNQNRTSLLHTLLWRTQKVRLLALLFPAFCSLPKRVSCMYAPATLQVFSSGTMQGKRSAMSSWPRACREAYYHPDICRGAAPRECLKGMSTDLRKTHHRCMWLTVAGTRLRARKASSRWAASTKQSCQRAPRSLSHTARPVQTRHRGCSTLSCKPASMAPRMRLCPCVWFRRQQHTRGDPLRLGFSPCGASPLRDLLLRTAALLWECVLTGIQGLIIQCVPIAQLLKWHQIPLANNDLDVAIYCYHCICSISSFHERDLLQCSLTRMHPCKFIEGLWMGPHVCWPSLQALCMWVWCGLPAPSRRHNCIGIG